MGTIMVSGQCPYSRLSIWRRVHNCCKPDCDVVHGSEAARKLGVLVHHRYSRHFDLHPEGLISFRWTVHNFSRPVRHGISGVEGVHEQK